MRGLVFTHEPAVALEHRIGRQRKHDHQELRRQRFHGRIETQVREPGQALHLGERDDALFLEFLHRLTDELDRHRKQEGGRDDEQRSQGNPARDQVDEIEQHNKPDGRRGEPREQRCTPTTFGARERIDEQHGLRALAKHREKRQRCHRPVGILRQCGIGLVGEIILPAARILLHHQPAADIKHQGRGDEDDDAFEDVAVLAGIQHSEQPGGNDAGADRGERAGIKRAHPVTAADLDEVARERRDHEHCLKPLAQQDNGGLNECTGHDVLPRNEPVEWIRCIAQPRLLQ